MSTEGVKEIIKILNQIWSNDIRKMEITSKNADFLFREDETEREDIR